MPKGNEIVSEVEAELHAARRAVASFPAEHPFIDMGWEAGWLFGIHFAHQYPELSFKIERDVFLKEMGGGEGQVHVDTIAGKLSERMYPPKTLSDMGQVERWVKLADRMKQEQVETTTDEFWPLPKEWIGWGWTQ